MTIIYSDFDKKMMEEVLELAWKGRYETSPNPMVGCVIAKNERIIAKGYHHKSGYPHAEIDAINHATESLKDATLYVNLEPCSHYGKTPPCAETILKTGITKVIASMKDPNPIVSGAGFSMLKKNGVIVQSGLLEEKARELNKGFLSRIERKRPYITLKSGQSLDGKVALKNGLSQWITSETSRHDVQEIRAQSCAILTGIGTVKSDNPRLNVRTIPTSRQPTRIVLDSSLSIPLSSYLIQDKNSPTLIITLNKKQRIIEALNSFPHVEVILGKKTSNNQIDLSDLLDKLAHRNINHLLIEAGSSINGSFLKENLIDELLIYLAPKILGNHAIGLFNISEIEQINHTFQFKLYSSQPIENDLKLIYKSSYL